MKTQHRITYLVDLPEDRLDIIREFLTGMDVELDPIRNITVINDGAPEQNLLMGDAVPELVRAINEFTRNNPGLQELPEFPEFDESWTPGDCEALLNLALCHYQWDERNRILYEIDPPDPGAWQSLRQRLQGAG